MTVNRYEAAARTRKVVKIIDALLSLPEIDGDILAVDLDQLAGLTGSQPAPQWATLVVGVNAPSPETWAEVIAAVSGRQRSARQTADTDPFAGF